MNPDPMQLIMELPPEQLRELFNKLTKMFAQAPAPPKPAPITEYYKSVDLYNKSGMSLNGKVATVQEVHDGKTIFTGPPGTMIAYELWADGSPRTPGITLTGWPTISSSGTVTVGGSGTSLGPGYSPVPMKCRVKWYYAPYGTSEYELVGDISWTEHHTDNLDWERSQANLAWDPYKRPALTLMGWRADQLKTYYGRQITQAEFDAIKAVFTTGAPMPVDTLATQAPGAPSA